MEVIKTVWNFFQNEVLGMGWLSRFISTILDTCGLETTSRIEIGRASCRERVFITV